MAEAGLGPVPDYALDGTLLRVASLIRTAASEVVAERRAALGRLRPVHACWLRWDATRE